MENEKAKQDILNETEGAAAEAVNDENLDEVSGGSAYHPVGMRVKCPNCGTWGNIYHKCQNCGYDLM